MIHENKDRFWYVIAADGYLYCLGDCGDFEAAEKIAEDTVISKPIWFIDPIFAKQWYEVLKQ